MPFLSFLLKDFYFGTFITTFHIPWVEKNKQHYPRFHCDKLNIQRLGFWVTMSWFFGLTEKLASDAHDLLEYLVSDVTLRPPSIITGAFLSVSAHYLVAKDCCCHANRHVGNDLDLFSLIISYIRWERSHEVAFCLLSILCFSFCLHFVEVRLVVYHIAVRLLMLCSSIALCCWP